MDHEISFVKIGACDDCIIIFMVVVSWAVCILELVGIDVPEEIEQAVFLSRGFSIIMQCFCESRDRSNSYLPPRFEEKRIQQDSINI